MSPSDAHSVLGLPYNASKEEVKQAYRKLCLLHHPDLCPPEKRVEAERTFKLITEAYSRLASGDARRWTGSSTRQGVTRQRSTYSWHRAPAARSSNGLVALVFCLPLVLAGVHVAMNQGGRSDLGDGTRPHGLLNPPVNPWLADRYKPRQRIRGAPVLEGLPPQNSSLDPGQV